MFKSSKGEVSVLIAILIAVVCLVIGIVVGYYLSAGKVATTTTTSIVTTLPEGTTATTAASTANWKTYTNTKYGFTLTFDDLWKGYQVKESVPNDLETLLRIYIPTTSAKYYTDPKGYANPLTIVVSTPAQWAELQKQAQNGEIPALGPVLAKNDKYVFTYGSWQDCPEDLCSKINSQELQKIISSFKVNQ